MKLAAYIPTMGEDEPIEDNWKLAFERIKVKNYIKRTFAESYGGYTVIEGHGGWMGEDGLVEEPVEIIYAFTDQPNIMQLRNIGRMVCNRLDQDAASIEHSGEMEIVTAPDQGVEIR